jgi:hypothetical protein
MLKAIFLAIRTTDNFDGIKEKADRNKNSQGNTLLETNFKEANRKTKDTLGE